MFQTKFVEETKHTLCVQ